MVRSYLKTPIIIAGPTGSGKSALAMHVAKKYGGEIICADSRQFYQGMSIGTAAPSPEEQNNIAHHGYGLIDPAHFVLDAGFFVHFAIKTINEIQERGKWPILVGGTGLYLRALCFGFSTNIPKSNENIKAMLLERANNNLADLYAELREVDTKTALSISANDAVRIVRSLEIFYLTKEKPSNLRQNFALKQKKLKAHWFCLVADRSWLLERLFKRCEQMFNEAFLAEVLALKERLPPDSLLLKTMGYEEALLFIDGRLSQAQAIERTFIRHRQYAKRQQTWFRQDAFYLRLDAAKVAVH